VFPTNTESCSMASNLSNNDLSNLFCIRILAEICSLSCDPNSGRPGRSQVLNVSKLVDVGEPWSWSGAPAPGGGGLNYMILYYRTGYYSQPRLLSGASKAPGP